jgi:hypothetical protein
MPVQDRKEPKNSRTRPYNVRCRQPCHIPARTKKALITVDLVSPGKIELAVRLCEQPLFGHRKHS